MRTSTPIALFSLALALYAAPFAQAAASNSNNNVRQLSDQNLFEAHLQKGLATSHKRLPSEVLSHHERSEEELEIVLPVAGPSSETSASTSLDTESSSSSSTGRQPSHFIKHFKHRASRLGKRRLSDSQDVFASVHFERDSDDLDSSIWQVPAMVARVIDSNTAIFSSSTPESSESPAATPTQPTSSQQAMPSS